VTHHEIDTLLALAERLERCDVDASKACPPDGVYRDAYRYGYVQELAKSAAETIRKAVGT